MKTTARLLSGSLLAIALAACGPSPRPAEEAAAPTPATAAEVPHAEGISISEAWVRQPPPSAQVAAGYMQIVNHGPGDDRLVAVETDAAGRVEIHEMEEVDGIMRMREIEGGLAVPAGGQVDLVPGGYHLMLMQPREGLEAGQQVDATLVFEAAGRMDVTFDVRPPDAGAGDHDGHGDHDHGH